MVRPLLGCSFAGLAVAKAGICFLLSCALVAWQYCPVSERGYFVWPLEFRSGSTSWAFLLVLTQSKPPRQTCSACNIAGVFSPVRQLKITVSFTQLKNKLTMLWRWYILEIGQSVVSLLFLNLSPLTSLAGSLSSRSLAHVALSLDAFLHPLCFLPTVLMDSAFLHL